MERVIPTLGVACPLTEKPKGARDHPLCGHNFLSSVTAKRKQCSTPTLVAMESRTSTEDPEGDTVAQ
eukprot:g14772.t1